MEDSWHYYRDWITICGPVSHLCRLAVTACLIPLYSLTAITRQRRTSLSDERIKQTTSWSAGGRRRDAVMVCDKSFDNVTECEMGGSEALWGCQRSDGMIESVCN